MCFHRSYSLARAAFMRSHYEHLKITKKFFEGKRTEPNLHPQIQLPPTSLPSAPADTALLNAHLHGHPDADCILLKENRILYTGTAQQAKELMDESTKVLDVRGGLVTPGFGESHIHLTIGAEHVQGCDVEKVTTLAELEEKIRSFSKAHPDLGALHVYGLHYLDPPILPAQTTRKLLDTIVDDRPLFIYAHDLHTGWANTRALEVAGLMHPMPPWPNLLEELNLTGNVELDADGIPTGELREPDVYFIVEATLRATYPQTVEQKLDGLRNACEYLAAQGLTSVHNMGLGLPEEDIELLILLLELEERGELPIRVSTSISVLPDESMFEDIDGAALIRNALMDARAGRLSRSNLNDLLIRELNVASRRRHEICLSTATRHPHTKDHPHLPVHLLTSLHFHRSIHQIHVQPHLDRQEQRRKETEGKFLSGSGRVTFHNLKIFMDGVVEKDTAFRSDTTPCAGIPVFNESELDAVIGRADLLGFQVAAHCIGDASVDAVLKAIERTRERHAKQDKTRGHRIRHRIEHIELCRPQAIPQFGPMEVIPSMQPLHERPPITMWHQKVPKTEWPTAFAWHSLLDAGAHLTFGSDWPIVSCNALDALHRAVRRTPWEPGMPNQGVNFDEGIHAFTAGHAHSEYDEHVRGALQSGMLADLTILAGDFDPLNPAPEALHCVGTLCGGSITFQDPKFQPPATEPAKE